MNRLLVAVLLFLPILGLAQRTPAEADTAYIADYTKQLTTRFYFSQKYSSILFKEDGQDELRYRPNTTLNMGVGASLSKLTLNLALGFNFLNPNREARGETKYLDLQTHFYTRMLLLDLWGQNYRGYYLKDGEGYIVRPDLRLWEYGFFCQYVFNGRKYSHRAAYIQDEWQKKSSGSLLLGAQGYYSLLKADSALSLAHPDASSARFWNVQLGPTVGYAYTLVVKRHFFATASLSVGLDFGYSNYKGGGGRSWDNPVFNLTAFPRLSLGYNSEKWALNALFLTDRIGLARKDDTMLSINSGNYRLIFTRRFGIHIHTENKWLKKILPE